MRRIAGCRCCWITWCGRVQFLDEPTSGLDARSAAAVMAAVRNVATNGRTVMVTIHQPSIEIFEAFDRLVLLGMGGVPIYVGKVGAASRSLVDYFEVRPRAHPCVLQLAELVCQYASALTPLHRKRDVCDCSRDAARVSVVHTPCSRTCERQHGAAANCTGHTARRMCRASAA